jgi:hypothetical protein
LGEVKQTVNIPTVIIMIVNIVNTKGRILDDSIDQNLFGIRDININ